MRAKKLLSALLKTNEFEDWFYMNFQIIMLNYFAVKIHKILLVERSIYKWRL